MTETDREALITRTTEIVGETLRLSPRQLPGLAHVLRSLVEVTSAPTQRRPLIGKHRGAKS